MQEPKQLRIDLARIAKQQFPVLKSVPDRILIERIIGRRNSPASQGKLAIKMPKVVRTEEAEQKSTPDQPDEIKQQRAEILREILRKEADYFYASEDYQNALTRYLRLSKERSDSDIYYRIAACHMELEDYDAAIVFFKDYLKSNDQDALAHFYLADCLAIKWERQEAITHLKKVIEMCPLDPDPLVEMGRIYHDLERTEEAVECYKRALVLDPNNKDIRRELDSIRPPWWLVTSLLSAILILGLGFVLFLNNRLEKKQFENANEAVQSHYKKAANCKASMECYKSVKIEAPKSLLAPGRVILYGPASFGQPYDDSIGAAELLKGMRADYDFRPVFDNNSSYGFYTPYSREIRNLTKLNPDKVINTGQGLDVQMVVDGKIYRYPSKETIEQAIKTMKK